MSSRLTRAQQQERTRRRLLEVAADLFADRGYQATSLEQIAEKASVTKGAVYSNFSSKAELALAVLDELVLGPKVGIFSEVDAKAPFTDQHGQGGKMLVDAMDATQNWFVVELECILQSVRDPELRSRLQARDLAVRTQLETFISERMAEAGWVPTTDISKIVDALKVVSNGLALQRLKGLDYGTHALASELIAAVYSAFAVEARSLNPR